MENGKQAEMEFRTETIVYAFPGQSVSASVAINNGVSICCDPGDPWPWCSVMLLNGLLGSGWQLGITQGVSDCRTQHWSIPVPFTNNDTDVVYASYGHGRAGGIIIRVTPYTDPNPSQSRDMDPVNTFTGALRMTDEDYSNTDIEFKRYYNPMTLTGTYTADSAKRWKNPVGFGWQHNCNIFIEEIKQIVVNDTTHGCLIHEGITINLYIEDSLGNYHQKKGNHSNLKKSGSTWKLYKPNGEVYYFGSSGKIDSIVDRNGRKTSFSYAGNYLSQVTGKDDHTLSFSYSSDSLLIEVSITENSNTKKFEYRYAPVTLVFNADSDTFDLLGTYYLTQVLQHYPTGSSDSLMSIYKYYYDNENLKMVAKIFPQDAYTQSDTEWEGNYKKGDRLYIWYDSKGQTIYHEIIEGDGDTLLSNDIVTYRAYTEYFRKSSNPSRMDSTLTYIYQQDAGTGSAHDPYDTTFTPQAPSSNYSVRKRDYHNDPLGRQIIIETRPDAGSSFAVKYFKDSDFNDTLVILPDNDTIKYDYKTYTLNDSIRQSPNPEKMIYPDGDSILFYYHAPDTNAPSFFLTDSTKDELSRKTEYYYDNSYNLDSLRYLSRYVAGTGITNITTDYTYNSKGNLTQLEDPLGNSTYFSYTPNDTGSYLTKTRIDFSPSGQGNEDIITKYSYIEDIGKVDTIIYFRDYPSDSSIVYYTYDVMNRLKEIYYPDGTKDVFTYDKRGNLVKKETYESTTCHFKIEYEYDAMDHLTKVKEYKDAASSSYDSTIYKYNLDGDLISFINANDTTGISTEVKYTYDAGRLLKVEYPDTTDDSLGYYADSYLEFKRDRRGKVISYEYDERNRLTLKSYFNSFTAYQSPDSVPAESLVFTYDNVGNLVTMLDKNGTMSYSYDGMDKLDTLSCYQDILITYEYDKGGNRTELKVFNASVPTDVYLNQNYPSYDEANRVEKTVVGTDTFNFNYWDTGHLKKIVYPNGVEEQYTLTSRNFLNVITDSSGTNQLFKFDYTYNEVGDRDTLSFYVSRPGQSSKSGTISYSYDGLRRLTEAKYPASIYGKTNKYTYDKMGNRLKKKAGNKTTKYTYNKRNNQLLTKYTLFKLQPITPEKIAVASLKSYYYYDDNGNMVKFKHGLGKDTLFYDFENRLVEFASNPTTIPPSPDTVWYNYCGMGKRISKIEKEHGQNPDTTTYAYDGMYAVCEFGGHLDLQSKYIYANGLLLARYDASPQDTHYYHHDGLGSIMGMTDESGDVEQSYFYDEFGKPLGNWGCVINHYLYTGQEYDNLSGLYNLRARYYDRGIGRFISEDPLLQNGYIRYSKNCSKPLKLKSLSLLSYVQTPQSLNAFLYVDNNPINWIDPTGLKIICDIYWDDFINCIVEEFGLSDPIYWLAICGGLYMAYPKVGIACFLGYPFASIIIPCLIQYSYCFEVKTPEVYPEIPYDILTFPH